MGVFPQNICAEVLIKRYSITDIFAGSASKLYEKFAPDPARNFRDIAVFF